MTTDALIDQILEREGGYVDHPADRGGPTHFGITAQTLGEWRHLGRPASRADVRALTVAEARAIYWARYVVPFEAVPVNAGRAQLCDWGVTSGPVTAIRALQTILGVKIDGRLGPRTLAAIGQVSGALLNQALVAARVQAIVALVERDSSQRVFLFGWLRRAVSFCTMGAA